VTRPKSGPKAAAKPVEHHYIVVEGRSASAKRASRASLPTACLRSWCWSRRPTTLFSSVSIAARKPAHFPAQLYFLFQRAQQLGALNQADLFTQLRIADYLIEKDRLFAQVTLDEAEYSLYDQVYAKLGIVSPKPDLVVYLQAPASVLLERIVKRGIDYEQRIDVQYLERLNEAYAKFFHEYEAAPLLIVNAASIDPVGSDSDYEELLAAIRRMNRGKLYYNPLRSRTI